MRLFGTVAPAYSYMYKWHPKTICSPLSSIGSHTRLCQVKGWSLAVAVLRRVSGDPVKLVNGILLLSMLHMPSAWH